MDIVIEIDIRDQGFIDAMQLLHNLWRNRILATRRWERGIGGFYVPLRIKKGPGIIIWIKVIARSQLIDGLFFICRVAGEELSNSQKLPQEP